MTARREPFVVREVPRVALRYPDEVARSLGVSVKSVRRHLPGLGLRVFYAGRLRLVLVSELEDCVRRNSTAIGALWDEQEDDG